jgi:hypothetical protein
MLILRGGKILSRGIHTANYFSTKLYVIKAKTVPSSVTGEVFISILHALTCFGP